MPLSWANTVNSAFPDIIRLNLSAVLLYTDQRTWPVKNGQLISVPLHFKTGFCCDDNSAIDLARFHSLINMLSAGEW